MKKKYTSNNTQIPNTDSEHDIDSNSMPKEINLMPGPVFPLAEVNIALTGKPLSHRTTAFEKILKHNCDMLCQLTKSPKTTIAMGSGTLANDLIAYQLKQIPGTGLILNNGEFGSRLIDHATRIGLKFKTLETQWGEAFTKQQIEQAINQGEKKNWLWAVHAETSTGVFNNLAQLKQLSKDNQLNLCMDCISSLGVVPCDLRGIRFASGVSGKGLRCMSGLAMVFHDKDLPSQRFPIPRYLDLKLYQNGKVPFTLPSNLLSALEYSLETMSPENRYMKIKELADWLSKKFSENNIETLAKTDVRFPGIFTFKVPTHKSSKKIGAILQKAGWLLNYQSEYLIQRNLLQISLIGHVTKKDLKQLPKLLAQNLKGKTE